MFHHIYIVTTQGLVSDVSIRSLYFATYKWLIIPGGVIVKFGVLNDAPS
ncbi:hypothetical protein HRbin02_01748 [Candidatus Calditenuaceae archaeon HR02]|nr:hypothetical protein HRbin02_01748 [Candidatus Calditenuaceae archaeon HR02]